MLEGCAKLVNIELQSRTVQFFDWFSKRKFKKKGGPKGHPNLIKQPSPKD